MAGLDTNKISNILGTKLPQWLINQLGTRAVQGSQDRRDNDNILFLANKSAWVRLVSSINIYGSDIRHFSNIVGTSIQKPEDLAKQFVLFGGTSKYLRENSYQQRAGIGKDGAYGILGENEVRDFGFRPMPGLTSVSIETQGKLGSLRAATINFRCWDKAQLDIIDALYFKLGFTMFLEWGNTFFYRTNGIRVESSELYSIDPFKENLTKEEIAVQISKNVRNSEGNYDALLGMVTNFNFTYNQDGGYDCTIKLMGLGILGDSIKINNPKDLPNILAEEIRDYNNTLIQIATAEERARILAEQKAAAQQEQARREQLIPVDELIKKYVTYNPSNGQVSGGIYPYPSTAPTRFEFADLGFETEAWGRVTVIRRLKGFIPQKDELFERVKIKLDYDKISSVISKTGINLNSIDVWQALDSIIERAIPERENNSREGTFTYRSNNGLDYNIRIKRKFFAVSQNKDAVEQFIPIKVQDFSQQFLSVIKNTNNEYKPIKITQEDFNTFSYTLKFSVPFSRDAQVLQPQATNPDGSIAPRTTKTEKVLYNLEVELTFEDSSFIKSFTTEGVTQPLDFIGNQAAIAAQNQNQFPAQENQSPGQEASIEQITQALQSQSGLELTLRTIQVHALNKAIKRNNNDISIGKKVFVLNIWDEKDAPSGVPFYRQIFSNGIYSTCVADLIDGNKINDSVYSTNTNISAVDRFRIYAKYGFATELLSGREEISKFSGKQVNYQDLLRAFVVPYEINQEIIKGTSTTHPVYIPLGLLLMILNHNCTIYDTKNSTLQTPLIYIDYNPKLNFFLSNNKQLSTNPWVTLIPFEGGFGDYQSLFVDDILSKNKTAIAPLSGSREDSPLFNTQNQDLLSYYLPPIKSAGEDSNTYKGNLMNVLLNVDYLVKLVRDYSFKDGTNSIYLKTFLEQVISDVNKYLGNFNALRLAYNDGANTYQIVDDQILPPGQNESILQPKDNTTQIPLVGKTSIAKNLEIKTEVSNKLANMIAISANSDVKNKSTLSVNGDNFGFINTNYKDRYVPTKGDVTTNLTSSLDSVKASAIQFNKTISDFYSKINPSEATVSQATNYYIERMSKIKNDDYPTRASTMIPVSVNFTTDGISGLTMGQAFTISDQLLPYTYNNRSVEGVKGLEKDSINKVGFVVTGLSNTIENNQWNTTVKGNMIFLKDATDFSGSFIALRENQGAFGVNANNAASPTVGQAPLGDLNVNQSWEQIAFDFISKREGFLDKPRNDEGTLRAGYGTDKIVLANGEIKSVGPNTVFTREDAKRTLIYQIKTTFAPKVINQIGQDKWNSLNDKQKASLVSFTYNVGSLRSVIVTAIKSNTGATAVANAISEGPVTGRVSGFLQELANRRKAEATLYLS